MPLFCGFIYAALHFRRGKNRYNFNPKHLFYILISEKIRDIKQQ